MYGLKIAFSREPLLFSFSKHLLPLYPATITIMIFRNKTWGIYCAIYICIFTDSKIFKIKACVFLSNWLMIHFKTCAWKLWLITIHFLKKWDSVHLEKRIASKDCNGTELEHLLNVEIRSVNEESLSWNKYLARLRFCLS